MFSTLVHSLFFRTPIPLLSFHYLILILVSFPSPFPTLSTLPHLSLSATTAAVCHSDCRTRLCLLLFPPVLDLMDPPPTGLLAGSTAPPPRQAVFNPYRLPVSPPPGNIRPQPHRQPELLWLHWMVCLAAWTTEALCAHPMMSQEVPPDEHFQTISARNIYIQTRRAVHEFNVQQRRIARGVSLLQHVVPHPDENTTFGQYRVNPNGFIRALGTPEENLALGTAADEALLSRLHSHRNHDSNSPPESPPTPATPATPPHTCPLSHSYATTQSSTPITRYLHIHLYPMDDILPRFYSLYSLFGAGSFPSTSS